MTEVTAAIIVRNEENSLPGCLRSLEGCVDRVVIVDTGSTDNTRDIARGAGASVYTFDWTGDFAAARNAALDRVTTSWTLYIDADERVSVPDEVRIGSLLDIAAHAGGFVRFRPRTGYSRYREPRIFRTDPTIRFQGRIHETMVPNLNLFAANHRLTIPMTTICINHYGYEGDQSHKVQRNLPLLKAEVEDNPERSYCWHHLAETLALAGRSQEAISVCLRGLASTSDGLVDKDRIDRRQIKQTLSRLLIENGDDARAIISSLLDEDSGDFAALYLMGRASLQFGDFERALEVGRSLVKVDANALEDSLVAYDLRLFGEYAWALLGAANFQAGRRIEAGQAYQQAWRQAPDNLAYLCRATTLGAHKI